MSDKTPEPTSPDFPAWYAARQQAEADAKALMAWKRYDAASRFERVKLRQNEHALIERGRELSKAT